MKNFKSRLYFIFVPVLLLGLAAIGLGLLKFTVSVEPSSPDSTTLPVIKPPSAPIIAESTPPPTTPTTLPSSPTLAASPSKNPDPAAVAAHQGGLRVSNRTERPVRLALLARQAKSKAYREPAHWDFAPLEGGSQGLILSLPQESLKLNKGDILVAFAEDGSRQYWGPYVVGETPLPIWNQQKAEWLLVLQPDSR